MPDYPTSIAIPEEKLAKLTATYKAAYKQIYEEIAKSTQFGASRRRQILNQVEAILKDLGQDTQKFIEEEIPNFYREGADQVVDQLKATEAPLKIKKGFNKIHREAIAALVDDTAKAFAESITGVNRSARLLLGKAVREAITQQLATGEIGGAALKRIQKQIVGLLQEEGLDALVDKGGKSWSLDTYAEMLIRTKGVEARNTGLKNRLVENDFDLVQVSAHGATDVCGPWENKVLSVTGATPGYPTIAEAEADGLFHPNCKHAINGFKPDLAAITQAYNPEVPTLSGGRLEAKLDLQDKYTEKPIRVYRGEGGQNPASQFDAYGKGRYYTTNKSYAQSFGKVAEATVEFKNPLILETENDLERVSKDMAAQDYNSLTEYAKSKGFDGIVDLEGETIIKF